MERALRSEIDKRPYVIADEGMPTWTEIFAYLADLLGVAPPRIKLSPKLVLPTARLTEGLWQHVAPQTEPPLTRYRAELMVQDVHFSTRASKTDLGYTPRYTWQQGLTRSLEAMAQTH